ncbi:MAG: hypothetical protein H6730_25135 [Deltaproteobacteria bacterium]|nr:hypothetical protein [Deltaproteobacteria bacterium]
MLESGGAHHVVTYNLSPTGARIAAGVSGSESSPLKVSGPFGADPIALPPAGNIEVGLEAPLDGGGWFGVVLSHGTGTGAAAAATRAGVEAFVGGRTPQEILQAELDLWSAWQAASTVPPNLHPYEEALYRQSLVVLKMGQVREPGRGHGQILASLVPGAWAISWVRDAAYAIMGLTRAGHHAEAEDALRFMLGAEMRRAGGRNFYQASYIERDLGVTLSADYAISVTRYYGDGTEESDSNAAGPNIEFDNWGLFLWALTEHVEASGDDALLTEHWPTISARVADLLVELIEPETGLLYPDSSIWERHWNAYGGPEPETRKHYTYSNICAYQGLAGAARLAARVGDAARATRYADASAALAQAVLTNLVITPAATGAPTCREPRGAGPRGEVHGPGGGRGDQHRPPRRRPRSRRGHPRRVRRVPAHRPQEPGLLPQRRRHGLRPGGVGDGRPPHRLRLHPLGRAPARPGDPRLGHRSGPPQLQPHPRAVRAG